MSRALVPIDLIAQDCCGDIGDSMGKFKFRFIRHIVWGYSRLHRLLLGEKEMQSVILPYDNVINLPCDFTLVSKVGVRRVSGGPIALLYASSSSDRQILSDTATCDYLNSVWNGAWTGAAGYPFYGVYGNVYGELYGMGRTVVNNATYYVDASNGTLYIGSNIPPGSEIIIEYIGSGFGKGLKVVPIEMRDCLTYWAKKMFYADRDRVLSQDNWLYYKKEYNVLKAYYQHKTPTQIAVAVNTSISPTNY